MSNLVKFVPFQSVTEPSFWMELSNVKLNTTKLSEAPIDITGSYSILPIVKRSSSETNQSMTDLVPNDKKYNEVVIPGRMRLDHNSMQSILTTKKEDSSDSSVTPFPTSERSIDNERIRTQGKIVILNTLDSFKSINKNCILNQLCVRELQKTCGVRENGLEVDETNENGNEEGRQDDLDSLTSFFCLAYLDLKEHKVVYWFAFPALTPVPGKAITYADSSSRLPQELLKDLWGLDKIALLHYQFYKLRYNLWIEGGCHCPPFFIVTEEKENNNLSCLPFSLRSYLGLSQIDCTDCYFVFVDPTEQYCETQSNDDTCKNVNVPHAVGWSLRNLSAYLTLKFNLGGKNVRIISFRPGILRRLQSTDTHQIEYDNFHHDARSDSSILLHIRLLTKDDYTWSSDEISSLGDIGTSYVCSGWELNSRSKAGPRSIDLSSLLSPTHLAQQATDLNLRLMKWRMIPTLNIELLRSLRVLLLGAGTLGCSVARTLLGWGVRDITFVDNGKVSYSNPVRQSLFEMADCENGGVYKALAAADAIKRIAGPSFLSEGVVLSIPMPGHPFTESESEAVYADFKKLRSLFLRSDVIFLLTDTRESRWLPTVLARSANKMLINAALGLDSWLVIRHGGDKADRLGCYFCNDVVAPENSTLNRTLDQQCTVTRPGLAPIAASMAVELMVALIHHTDKHDAPAPLKSYSLFSSAANSIGEESPLGIMPHQIRGSIVSYTMMTPSVPAFPYCTGCSAAVVREFKDMDFEFVSRVCCETNGSYLERLSGLTKFRDDATVIMEDCSSWDGDEQDIVQ